VSLRRLKGQGGVALADADKHTSGLVPLGNSGIWSGTPKTLATSCCRRYAALPRAHNPPHRWLVVRSHGGQMAAENLDGTSVLSTRVANDEPMVAGLGVLGDLEPPRLPSAGLIGVPRELPSCHCDARERHCYSSAARSVTAPFICWTRAAEPCNQAQGETRCGA
jgi:hypothetical protein